MIEVYFDGSCEPNPKGIACYAFVVYRDGKKIYQESGLACEPFSVYATNNVAEYMGLIKALEWLIASLDQREVERENIIIKGDSELIIKQMLGLYLARSARLRPLHLKASKLARRFKNIAFVWVPREKNRIADLLTQGAYVKYIETHPEAREKIKKYLATKKQRYLLKRLGIRHNKYITKQEAKRKIEQVLRKLKEKEKERKKKEAEVIEKLRWLCMTGVIDKEKAREIWKEQKLKFFKFKSNNFRN